MNKDKLFYILKLCSILFASGQLIAGSTLTVGDGQIDGRKLRAYELTWNQCSATDGVWQNAGSLSEELDPIGDHVLRHRQYGSSPDGARSISTSFFDRQSMALLRIEGDFYAPDGQLAGHSEYVFGSDGYHGAKQRGEESKAVSGALTSQMLHGAAMGLPLATLPVQDQQLTFLASMIAFDASYEVTATWAGTEELEDSSGRPVVAHLVDVEWKHRELGDIYPPGPDGSGGRYWIVPDAPEGFPYVPIYKTDSYAVEFVQKFCPDQ